MLSHDCLTLWIWWQHNMISLKWPLHTEYKVCKQDHTPSSWSKCHRWIQCCAVIARSFSSESSQHTPHSSPIRVWYGISFVSLYFDLYSASTNPLLYKMSCYVRRRYEDTRQLCWGFIYDLKFTESWFLWIAEMISCNGGLICSTPEWLIWFELIEYTIYDACLSSFQGFAGNTSCNKLAQWLFTYNIHKSKLLILLVILHVGPNLWTNLANVELTLYGASMLSNHLIMQMPYIFY